MMDIEFSLEDFYHSNSHEDFVHLVEDYYRRFVEKTKMPDFEQSLKLLEDLGVLKVEDNFVRKVMKNKPMEHIMFVVDRIEKTPGCSEVYERGNLINKITHLILYLERNAWIELIEQQALDVIEKKECWCKLYNLLVPHLPETDKLRGALESINRRSKYDKGLTMIFLFFYTDHFHDKLMAYEMALNEANQECWNESVLQYKQENESQVQHSN
jgi:hypothetical protein